MIMKLIFFSARNALRNKRRSLLTIIIVLLSFVMLGLFQGYITNSREGWGDILIHNEFGHFQIFDDKYFTDDETSYDHMIDKDRYEKIEAILSNFKEVEYFSPRIRLSGLIGNDKISKIFIGSARMPDEFTQMYYSSPAYRGEFLTDELPFGIVIGTKLAEKLDKSIGDEVLLMGYSRHKSIEAVNCKIIGLSKTGNEQFDSMSLYMRISDASDFLLLDTFHNIVVVLKDGYETQPVIDKIQKEFDKNGLGLTIKSFSENAMFFTQIQGMYSNYFKISLGVLALIIFFSVSNTIYMSITDRIKEYATIKTIGLPYQVVFFSIIFEGMILTTFAVLLGVVISIFAHQAVNLLNLSLPPPPGSDMEIPFKVIFNWNNILALSGVFIILSMVSSIFPAINVVRTSILKGLKSV